MSVTFSVESPIVGWVSACACGEVRTTTLYASYDEVRVAIDAKVEVPLCGNCSENDDMVYASAVALHDDAPEVNVSNTNATTLLQALGLHEVYGDLTGSLSGAEFAAKVMQARVLEPQDAGVPVSTSGIVVDCGRQPGYVQDRLESLQKVADFAWDKDAVVTWG